MKHASLALALIGTLAAALPAMTTPAAAYWRHGYHRPYYGHHCRVVRRIIPHRFGRRVIVHRYCR